MHKLLILVVAFATLEMIQCLKSDLDFKESKYFNVNPKAVDYKVTGKKDEHRYGVELKENKQFHHTKTAEDGVRLGCYGHELDGKKYSTHYVADGKGYRLVPHQGVITVYPKDGGEARKASFVQSFNEEDITSSNIRYFFPDGCSSAKAEFAIPPIEKKDEVIEVPETTTAFLEETTTELIEETTITTTEAPRPVPSIHYYLPAAPAISVKLEITLPTSIYSHDPFFVPYKQEAKQCSQNCCDEIDSSKIVIPINKEMMEKMDTNEIIKLSKETSNVKMVEKLLKLVEKSKA